MKALGVVILVIATLAASTAATGGALRLLKRRAILDHPNARSSHVVPTPRGGGLAVVPVVIAAWLGTIALGAEAPVIAVCALAAAALAALSWWDDLTGLSPLVRFVGHAATVFAVLFMLPDTFDPFAGHLPSPAGPMVAALLWLWFVNLFNFMDGIDGIAATETATIGVGVAAVAAIIGMGAGLIPLGLTAAAAAIGFLWWNRPPARIFLGDVGSVPLGFLLGGLLLMLAVRGQWAAALILPLYYLADAGLTIGRRVLRGEKFWLAHRQHAYQHAVDGGRSHGAVVGRIAAVNAVLAGLAGLSAAFPDWSLLLLAAAVVAVGLLLAWMRRGTGTP